MQKQYFIGIDSDGTAFDSMTIKHRRAFIPAMLKEWRLETYAEAVTAICETINLFSQTRGIDRFSGLVPTFQQFKAAGIPIPDIGALPDFLKSPKLSNATLTDYLTTHPDDFLQHVLHWSQEADRLFKEAVKDLPPFRGVLKVLKALNHRAQVAVISSATESSLRADWQKEGMIDYVDRLYGQECGNKKAQLKLAVEGHFSPQCAMMFGDAKGDYQAALSVNAWFYPIVPGHEEESWETFNTVYLQKFLTGHFDGQDQQDVLQSFSSVL